MGRVYTPSGVNIIDDLYKELGKVTKEIKVVEEHLQRLKIRQERLLILVDHIKEEVDICQDQG